MPFRQEIPLAKKIPAVLDQSRIFCHTATGLKSRIVNATAAKHSVHGACAPEEEATGRNRFRTAWRHAFKMFQHVKRIKCGTG